MRICIRLKHVIQDHIDNENVEVDGFMKNKDHMVFKKPLIEYEKGKLSTKKNRDSKVYYIYTDNDNVIHMLEHVEERIHMVRPKGDKHNYSSDIDEPPKVILRGIGSSSTESWS